MTIIANALDAKKLRDAMKAKHNPRIAEFRRIRDCRMDDVLNKFREVLAPNMRDLFTPYQSPVPNQEVRRLKHLMVSNETEVKVIVHSTKQQLLNKGQKLENGLEALLERLFPVEVQLDECEFMGDPYVIVSLEPIPGSPELAKFADEEKLREYAESELEEEPDDDDLSAPAVYRRAYKQTRRKRLGREDAGDDDEAAHEYSHDAAYVDVTREAQIRDGLRWRIRIIDGETFEWFDGDEPESVAIGMEYGKKPLNPVLTAFADYGLRKGADGRLIVEKREEQGGDKPASPSYAALGSNVVPDVPTSTSNPLDAELVDYAQFRTHEGTFIYIEHPAKLATQEDPGVLIQLPNLFGGKSTGYYILAGDTKLRGVKNDRYDPPILAVLREAMHLAIFQSAAETMAIEEATRDVYQIDENAASESIEPHDPSQETKAVIAEDREHKPPVASGEVKRIESTGLDVKGMREIIDENLQRHETRELWGGSGSSSETGILLARRETALLTELVPYQVKRATLRKRVLEDFLTYVEESGETVALPFLPKSAGGGERSAEMREITPDMARLPFDLQITIGAETPESKYGRMQMSQQQTQFGTWSMTTHRENSGVKDPAGELKRIIKDNIVQAAVGVPAQPGWIPNTVTELIQKYAKARIERKLGPAPVEQAPVLYGPNGEPLPPSMPMGDAGGRSPVQIAEGGTPVAPGGMRMSA